MLIKETCRSVRFLVLRVETRKKRNILILQKSQRSNRLSLRRNPLTQFWWPFNFWPNYIIPIQLQFKNKNKNKSNSIAYLYLCLSLSNINFSFSVTFFYSFFLLSIWTFFFLSIFLFLVVVSQIQDSIR